METKGIQTFTIVFSLNHCDLPSLLEILPHCVFRLHNSRHLTGGRSPAVFDAPLGSIPLIGSGISVIALGIVYLSQTVLVAYTSFGIAGLYVGVTLPARDAVVNFITDDRAVGQTFGIAFTGLSLAGVTAPVVFGPTTDIFEIVPTFALIGSCYLLRQ